MQNNLSGNWHQVKTSYDRAQLLLHYFDYSFTSIQRLNYQNFSIELTGFYSSASYLGTENANPSIGWIPEYRRNLETMQIFCVLPQTIFLTPEVITDLVKLCPAREQLQSGLLILDWLHIKLPIRTILATEF